MSASAPGPAAGPRARSPPPYGDRRSVPGTVALRPSAVATRLRLTAPAGPRSCAQSGCRASASACLLRSSAASCDAITARGSLMRANSRAVPSWASAARKCVLSARDHTSCARVLRIAMPATHSCAVRNELVARRIRIGRDGIIVLTVGGATYMMQGSDMCHRVRMCGRCRGRRRRGSGSGRCGR